MTAKEYYKSTRIVETRNWTLDMALNFAEEYAEALRQPLVSGAKRKVCDHSHCNEIWQKGCAWKQCLLCGNKWKQTYR